MSPRRIGFASLVVLSCLVPAGARAQAEVADPAPAFESVPPSSRFT